MHNLEGKLKVRWHEQLGDFTLLLPGIEQGVTLVLEAECFGDLYLKRNRLEVLGYLTLVENWSGVLARICAAHSEVLIIEHRVHKVLLGAVQECNFPLNVTGVQEQSDAGETSSRLVLHENLEMVQHGESFDHREMLADCNVIVINGVQIRVVLFQDFLKHCRLAVIQAIGCNRFDEKLRRYLVLENVLRCIVDHSVSHEEKNKRLI